MPHKVRTRQDEAAGTGLKTRLLKGLGANGAGKAVTVLIQALSIPLFLRFWGAGLWGEWLILSSVTTYFSMSDVGFTSVAANDMTMRTAAGDREGALRTFQSTWVLVTSVSFGIALVGFAAAWALPIHSWLRLSLITSSAAPIILSALLLQILAGLQLGLVDAGYRSHGLYARGRLLAEGLRLAEFIALVFVLGTGRGPTTAAVAVLITRIAGLAALRWDLRRKAPWVRYGFSSARRKTAMQLARPALAFTAFPLGNTMSNEGMTLIVGIALGPIAVASMSVVRTVVNSVRQLMDTVNGAVWPEVSTAFGAGDLGTARRLHRVACKASIWLALPAALGLLGFGVPLIDLWTGRNVAVDVRFFHMMLAVMVVKTLWFASSVVPVAVNRHVRMAGVYVAGTTLALAIAYWLTPAWGLSGVATGLLVADLLMAGYVVPSSLRLLQDQRRVFLISLVSPNWR